jgi:hypothetical protein
VGRGSYANATKKYKPKATTDKALDQTIKKAGALPASILPIFLATNP